MGNLFGQNVMQLFQKGGPVMYPLLAASLVGVAYIIYCLLILRRGVVLPAPLLDLAQKLDRQTDFAAAEALCRQEGGPFSDVILAAIASRDAGLGEAEALVEGAGRRAAHDLSHGTLVLELVAGVAPLLGLLGTVSGMYSVFLNLQKAGVKDLGSISAGIAEALIATIGGLSVAIMAFVAYTLFARRVDDLTLEMEKHATSVMKRLRAPAQG
jgi:biopolymer transport protein ExbB